jgi:hypothetical protein
MRRWTTFVMGTVVGAGLLYAVLNYHVIQASDGLHLVPKVDAQLAGTYVDIREFGVREWLAHPEIIAALRDAKQDALIKTAADDAARVGLDRLLGTDRNEE